jgi:phenylpropionate dioxygenase-like ring-hydroxylating dioxygenase large terminal subunit
LSHTWLDADGEVGLYESFRHYWLPVAYSDEVTDDPVAVRLCDVDIVLARLGGELRAFADLCPHRGAKISLGWIEDEQVRCGYHGWGFDGSGACTLIPNGVDSKIPLRARLRGFRCRESAGLVWVCLEDEPHFEIPRFDEYRDPDYRVVKVPAIDWNASAVRRIENFVDLAHIPWVHDGLLGDSNHPGVPDHALEREVDNIHMWGSFSEVASIKTDSSALEESDPTLTSSHSWRIFMPLTVWWEQGLPEDKRFGLLIAASPISRTVTRTFMLNFRNFALGESDAPFCQFQIEIAEQDRAIVESQRPEEIPVDLTAELHLRTADKMSIEYRRWLSELKDHLTT